VFSSEYAYALVKKSVKLKGDVSLIFRAVAFGVVLYFAGRAI